VRRLRRNVALLRRGRIIERRQILLTARRACPDQCPCSTPCPGSSDACCVGLDEARIDSKAFTAYEAGRNARPDEHARNAAEISLSRKRSLRARENAE